MARIVFGKIDVVMPSTNNSISFTLLNNPLVTTMVSITAYLSSDGQFSITLSDGEYEVAVHTDSGKMPPVGIITIFSTYIPINIADLLNVSDGGNKVDNACSTLYIIPRRLDEILPPLNPVSMAFQKLIKLASPTTEYDATTKEYVDNLFKIMNNPYIMRTVAEINSTANNKIQLFEQYKGLLRDTPIAVDNAFMIFPEARLRTGQGAIILIKPTINGNITTLEYDILQPYFDDIIIFTYGGETHQWTYDNKWTNIRRDISTIIVSTDDTTELTDTVNDLVEGFSLLVEKSMKEEE